jgi:hypothetical protein
MSRKSTFAIAAIAVLGFSTFLVTDADARGGHGFRGGGYSRSFHGHSYGGSFRGHSYGRSALMVRPSYVGRTGVLHKSAQNCGVYYCDGGKPPRPSQASHPRWHHPGWHRPYGWGYRVRAFGYGGTIMTAGGGGSSGADATPAAAPGPVAAAAPSPAPPPAATAPGSSCDYLLPDQPGCYMAMRPFSTPAGTELRCTKICDVPEGAPAAK